MATEKRDRQRANRAERQARDAKAKRRHDAFNLAKRWAWYALIIVAVVLAVALFFGD